MPRLPPTKPSNTREDDSDESLEDDVAETAEGSVSDEDELLESEDDESDDEEAILDLTDLEVFAFRPEGSGGKVLGRLTRKISSGSYGSVYEFEFAGGALNSKEPDPVDEGWVAKVTMVPAGFAPADLLRECMAQTMLSGHPGAPEIPVDIERRMGEIPLREVDKRRRAQMEDAQRRRLEHKWSASDRHLVVVMRDAGVTLEDACRDSGNKPHARYEILRSALPRVLSVLACLHSVKIAHRDVKLNNVLVDPERPEISTLIDYGLGKRLGRRNSDRIGALGYRSPETLDWNRDDYDASIDLFAVGCCFLVGMEEKLEDANVTDDIEALRLAEKKIVRRLKSCGWKGATAWCRVLQDFLNKEPNRRSSAGAALDKLRKGGALPSGFPEQHARWFQEFRHRARASLSFSVGSVALDPVKLESEEGRTLALKLIGAAYRNFGVPKIVATRTIELLDASYEAGFAEGMSGGRRRAIWRLAAASAFYLVSQYFEASGLAEPENVAAEFAVSISSMRAFHWRMLRLVGWMALRASSHLQPSDSLGPSELYDPQFVCKARRAVCDRPELLLL